MFFIVGVSGLLLAPNNKNNTALFWGLCVPLIYYSTDRIFRYLSFKIYKRDFFLYLRHSGEIEYGFFANNPHIKTYDVVFSIALLIMIVFTTVIGNLLL